MSKVYTGNCGTSEIDHGLCACTVDNPLAKARGLSLRTGAQPMLYLPLGEKNLLFHEQILTLKVINILKKMATNEMAELFPLEVHYLP